VSVSEDHKFTIEYGAVLKKKRGDFLRVLAAALENEETGLKLIERC